MSLDYLIMYLKYNIKNETFEVESDMPEEVKYEVVGAFLSGQMGKGKDTSKANIQDIYNIKFNWYPSNDRIVVNSDTGNKGLRDGILVHFLKYLKEGDKNENSG